MSVKGEPRCLSPEEFEEAGYDYADELYRDMNRSAQLLPDEHQEIVDNARALLEDVLGRMSSHVPKEPSESDILHLTRLVATAVKARNTIRYCFLKSDGYEMPEETVH
jgi:hypothetical protein